MHCGAYGAVAPQLADKVEPQSGQTILKKVLRHLPSINPSSFNSYSAITYHRFGIKENLSHTRDRLPNDTTKNTVNKNNNNYIFSSETLSFEKRLKPDYKQREILSNKVQGKSDDSLALLNVRLSDISLLEPSINLLNKNYLSPLSDTNTQNYVYSLIDSVSLSGDSLCLITFQPKEDKRFDGFNGTILINKKYLLILWINARSTPSDPQNPLLIVNQYFEQKKEFSLPSEKKIKVYFRTGDILKGYNHYIAESLTNIYQQEIDPPLHPDDFKPASQLPKNQDSIAVAAAKNYSYRPLNRQDSLLQLKTDSVLIAQIINKQTKLIRFITEGKIPLVYFNIDYNRIIGYNIYEGLKLGLGGETNRLLSKHFTLGGYFSIGLKDRSFRNGEWINFYPSNETDLRIQLSYKDVNMEFGEPEFLETKTLLNPESYRYLLIKNMYATKRYSFAVEYRPFKELNSYLFTDFSENYSQQTTLFLIQHPFTPISLTRTGVQLRYTPGIVLEMEDGRKKEMTVPIRDYYLTIIQGITALNGKYNYTKIEFKGKFKLPSSGIGTSTIMFRGGIMSQNGPVIEFFNSYGSYAESVSLSAPYSFATMRLNEFAAGSYAAIHFRNDFSTWLFPETFQKKPAFIFAQNIGFGRLNDLNQVQYNMKDYRKGFYESGFEVNNLLRMAYLSWGAGIYYRYGPYHFSSIHDNFAYKIGFFFKL